MFEQLETRALLAAAVESQVLDNFTITGNVGEKPESKIWKHAEHWWGVFSDSVGTHVWRLDGQTWTKTLRISTLKGVKVDAKADGDVTHVLFENNLNSQLYSLQYVPGSVPNYALWSQRPTPASVKLASSVEAATIDIDSNDRMWVAYDDDKKNIEVRYSDAPYSIWSNPIVLANNVDKGDIAALTTMPNGTIGVLWSNQTTTHFGFRTHVDGTDPSVWTADEVPASQSELNIDDGFADGHINLAVASDATLYAAIKTGYHAKDSPEMGILVRRPNGAWDFHDPQIIDGTRPIIQLNEVANTLIFSYDDDSNWVYHECNATTIVCSTAKVLLTEGDNGTSTKQTVTTDLVILTSGKSSSGKVFGAMLKFNATNAAPLVDAGADQSIYDTQSANLLGVVSDEGLPGPPKSLTTTWSKVSGPGLVAFADTTAKKTSASFSEEGVYVLELVASDGQLTSSDMVTITVVPTPPNQAPVVNAGKDQTILVGNPAALTGTFTDDDQPVAAESIVTTWSQVSGPGSVSFSDASSLQTSAGFSQPGIYVLELSVDDTALTGTDTITITVSDTPPETISFQDGVLPTVAYAGTRDTKLRADKQKSNFGKDKKLEIDGRPDYTSLLQWDVSEIQPGAIVTGASFTLNVENTSKHSFKIYELLRNWVENEATFLRSAKNVLWNTPGAAGNDSDRGSTVLGTITAPKKGLVTVELNAAGIAVVQKWVTDPSSNHGLVMQDFTDALKDDLDITSSEGSKSTTRPKLTIRCVPTSSPHVAPLRTSSLRNVDNPLDVNADTQVSPLDALLVINSLNGGSPEGEDAPRPTYFPDVSGDGSITPLDALLVINHLNGPHLALGEGEGTSYDLLVVATGILDRLRPTCLAGPQYQSRSESETTALGSVILMNDASDDVRHPNPRWHDASSFDRILTTEHELTLDAIGDELLANWALNELASDDARTDFFAVLAKR